MGLCIENSYFMVDVPAQDFDVAVTCIILLDPCTLDIGVGNKPLESQPMSIHFAWTVSLKIRNEKYNF